VTTAFELGGRIETRVKLLARVICLSALALMAALTGCAGDRSTRSTDQTIEDQGSARLGQHQKTDRNIESRRTAARVREALAAAADFKFGGVKVDADDGVVQLSGFVDTTAQRSLAGEVARKVADVKIVVNQLTVKD